MGPTLCRYVDQFVTIYTYLSPYLQAAALSQFLTAWPGCPGKVIEFAMMNSLLTAEAVENTDDDACALVVEMAHFYCQTFYNRYRRPCAIPPWLPNPVYPVFPPSSDPRVAG